MNSHKSNKGHEKTEWNRPEEQEVPLDKAERAERDSRRPRQDSMHDAETEEDTASGGPA